MARNWMKEPVGGGNFVKFEKGDEHIILFTGEPKFRKYKPQGSTEERNSYDFPCKCDGEEKILGASGRLLGCLQGLAMKELDWLKEHMKDVSEDEQLEHMNFPLLGSSFKIQRTGDGFNTNYIGICVQRFNEAPKKPTTQVDVEGNAAAPKEKAKMAENLDPAIIKMVARSQMAEEGFTAIAAIKDSINAMNMRPATSSQIGATLISMNYAPRNEAYDDDTIWQPEDKE